MWKCYRFCLHMAVLCKLFSRTDKEGKCFATETELWWENSLFWTKFHLRFTVMDRFAGESLEVKSQWELPTCAFDCRVPFRFTLWWDFKAVVLKDFKLAAMIKRSESAASNEWQWMREKSRFFISKGFSALPVLFIRNNRTIHFLSIQLARTS